MGREKPDLCRGLLLADWAVLVLLVVVLVPLVVRTVAGA